MKNIVINNKTYSGIDTISVKTTGGGTAKFEDEDILKSVVDGSVTSIKIPDNTTKIKDYLFYEDTNLTNVEFPQGLESIGNYAFYKCNLKHCTLPKNITTLGVNCFRGCDLQELTIPSSVTEIGNYAFSENVSLKNVTIPESVTTLGTYIFNGCIGLTDAVINSNITTIPSAIFYECSSLERVTLPSNITEIGNGAFRYCEKLTSINLPSTLTKIGSYSFENCKTITDITISYDVSSIGTNAFKNCTKVKSINFYGILTTNPSSITKIFEGVGTESEKCILSISRNYKIPQYLFHNANGLTKVNISANIETIENNAFNGCSRVKEYIFPATFKTIPTLSNANAFTGINADCKIYVPDALYDTWKTSTNWSTYASYIYKISERPAE